MMNLLQEYKELYYKEIENKNTMNKNMNTSITFFMVICSGHMIILNEMVKLDFVIEFFPVLFFIFELVSIIFTIVAMRDFYLCYYGYDYQYVSPKNIENSINTNKSFNTKISTSKIDEANYEMLSNTFIECAKLNREQNLRKNKKHLSLNSSIVKSILLIIVTYLIWIFFIK